MSTYSRRRAVQMAAHGKHMVASALTASALRAAELPMPNRATRVPQWQLDAFAYYDQIGAVRYSAQFAARALAKVRWFPATRDDNGEVKETKDEKIVSAFGRIEKAMQDQVPTFAQLDFLVGESLMVWTPAGVEDEDEECWEVVSTLELRKRGKRGGLETWARIKAPGLTPQELIEAPDDAFQEVGDEVQVYRFWRRHPVYSLLADSPMRSVLAECEEIVRSTHSINARLISRLAGPGILAIPQSWRVKPLSQVVGEENPDEDPFQARLTRAMITAISKPGSAESVAPIVISVPDETTGMAHLYKIWEPNEVIRELELREKALQRFAVGVDMPPEKVMGLSTSHTQHWNAWMVDEDAWGHIDPVAQAYADNWTTAYLEPACEQAGVGNPEQVCIGYDPAAVLANPDGFKDALELYGARAVGKKFLRSAGNAQDSDAMSDDELAEALFAQTHIEVEVKGGKIVPPEPKPVIAPIPPAEQAPPGSPNGQPPAANGQPPTGQQTPRQAPEAPPLSTASWMILGAADVSLEEIRGRIGSRLRAHLQGSCPECAERVKGVRSGLVACTLGADLVMEYGPDLVNFASEGGQHFVESLLRAGVTNTQARALAEVLELHAVATIYDPSPTLPAGFIGHVRALEAVGDPA